jgi:hypothetical protein
MVKITSKTIKRKVRVTCIDQLYEMVPDKIGGYLNQVNNMCWIFDSSALMLFYVKLYNTLYPSISMISVVSLPCVIKMQGVT